MIYSVNLSFNFEKDFKQFSNILPSQTGKQQRERGHHRTSGQSDVPKQECISDGEDTSQDIPKEGMER